MMDDHSSERNNRRFARATARINNHIAGGLGDGDFCPDGSCHWLFDQINFVSAS